MRSAWAKARAVAVAAAVAAVVIPRHAAAAEAYFHLL